MATLANYKVISPEALIQKFKYALDNKWGYIWGRAGEIWTAAKQKTLVDWFVTKYGPDWKNNAKAKKHDKYRAAVEGSKWIGHTVADCSGLFSWAFKQLGSYMYHGSNTIWNKYCTAKGSLSNGKRTDGKILKPGTAVFTYNKSTNNRGHIGLYIGDGWVIESEGTIKGVIKSKITNSKWVEWGELMYVNYMANEATVPTTPTVQEPKAKTYPTLRIGARGENVKTLQTLLAKDGSTLVIDGIFGSGTQSAVRAFQRRYGLAVDGIVGPQTWKKLRELYDC